MKRGSLPRRGFAAFYSLAAVVLVLRAGEPQDPDWWLGGMVFVLVVAAPILVGLWLARWFKSSVYHLFCILVVAAALFGFYLQWTAMFASSPDVQAPLSLVFVPFYQAVFVALAFIIAKIVDYYAKP